MFGDRRVDHPLGAELVEQSLGDLVGALILGDLLAHHEDVGVAPHFLGHGVAKRLADRHRHHLGAGRNIGIGGDRLLRLGRHGPRSRRGVVLRRGRRFRRLLARLLRGRLLRRRSGFAGLVFALEPEHGDRRIDLDVLRARRNQDAGERALVDRLDLHRRLVGFDFCDDVAGRHGIAFLLQPFGKRALLHGRRKRRHQNIDRHGLEGSLSDDARQRAPGRADRHRRCGNDSGRGMAAGNPRGFSDRCRSTVQPGPVLARPGRIPRPR